MIIIVVVIVMIIILIGNAYKSECIFLFYNLTVRQSRSCNIIFNSGRDLTDPSQLRLA